jgi:hypothetical protein
MASIDLALLCDHAFFDQYGRLCVAGVTHLMTLPRLPMATRELVLVGRLRAEQGERLQASVQITQPGGASGVPSEEGAVQIEAIAGHLIATIRNLPLPQEGVYTFKILLNGRLAVSVPLDVRVGQPVEGVH